MKSFQIKTKILICENINELISEFAINNQDLIFTNKVLDENYLNNISGIDRIYQEDFFLNEPNDLAIDKIFAYLSGKTYNRIIAIGGGSIIDVAKLLCLSDITNTQALFERKTEIKKTKELIIVPTTCGTGSEVTNVSISEIVSKKSKMGLATEELYPDYAVIIPELLEKLPYKFFLYSSLDALIHAMESFLSPKANAYTELFSLKAIELILKAYQFLITNGIEKRSEEMANILIASNFAGIAFGNAGVGAVHAMSYPLSGKYHVAHGEANFQFFIEVFKEYENRNPNGKIKELTAFIRSLLSFSNTISCFDALENFLSSLIKRTPLENYGMQKEEIVGFADQVIQTQQRLLGNNYVPFTNADLKKIYDKLYK